MRPIQRQIKPGVYQVTLERYSLDIVELDGLWYINQYPEPPIECGTSQSAAAFRAAVLLEAQMKMELAA